MNIQKLQGICLLKSLPANALTEVVALKKIPFYFSTAILNLNFKRMSRIKFMDKLLLAGKQKEEKKLIILYFLNDG